MARTSEPVLRGMVETELARTRGLPVVAWDLDSTVSCTVHRRQVAHAIRDGSPDFTWDDYAMLCDGDEPLRGTVRLMQLLGNYDHVAVSGRSMQAYALTTDWFRRHEVPVSALLLRPHGDHTRNGDWKVRVLRALQAAGASIELFCEDWDEVARQIEQELGIPVLGVNPFDPPELGARDGAI